MEKWNKLKERISEQLEDCRKHTCSSGNWNTVSRIYGEILTEMERIENGTYTEYKPFNGVWHTDEEIKQING